MKKNKQPKPYINPYLGGALLGIVMFLAFFLTGTGLGASGAVSKIQTAVLDTVASDHVNRVAYFAKYSGGEKNALLHPSVFLLIGVLFGGFLSGFFNKRLKVETRKGPRVSSGARWFFALLGGLIMGYGARLARGCTSGQALSGGAVLSVGSWAFMFCVFIGGYALAWFVRRLWT